MNYIYIYIVGLPGFEPGSVDSESTVLAITPQAPLWVDKLRVIKYIRYKILLDVLRRPGIEPGPRAWKARILTIELSTLTYVISTHCGDRTRDHMIKSHALYHLS